MFYVHRVPGSNPGGTIFIPVTRGNNKQEKKEKKKKMMLMYIVDTEEKSYMREEDETKYFGNDRERIIGLIFIFLQERKRKQRNEGRR